MRPYATAVLVAALAIFAAGCQSDSLTDVSGTVTLDGAPLTDGEVIFMSPDNSATPSAGPIKDGKFKFRTTTGAKKVQVNATRDTGRVEAGAPVRESIIPARYNTKTELEANVKPKEPNDFTFELKSKP